MKKSFRDPVSNVLKAHGFVDVNDPNDISREEHDDFALEPGKWRLVEDEWITYSAPPDIKAEISQIENQPGTMRFLRELALVSIEDLAERLAQRMTDAGQPTTKEQILAENIGYQKAKASDDEIRALRSQIK